MTEYIIRPAKGLKLDFSELWEFRELIFIFTWRDIKVKYKQTFLGFAWAVLQPLLMMGIFAVFFGRVLNVPSDGLPYPLFSFAGLMFWNIFATGVSQAGNSMVSNAGIIKKIYFPRLIIPLSSILSAVFDFLMTLLIYAALIIYYGISINIFFLGICFLFSLVLTIITTFGLGSLIAALNVKYRDFRYIIPFMIQVLLFVTPVIYPLSMVEKPWLKYILQLNPMAGAVSVARAGLLGKMPDPGIIGISSLMALILLIGGIIVFRKTESTFADLA